MFDPRLVPTRAPHLHLVSEPFPCLQSPEMRSIVVTMNERRLRRSRMDLEDQANAVRLSTMLDRVAP